MNVVILGGHGQIGLRLEKLLAARGDSPRGIIRKTEQAADLEEIGAEPIVLDIENVDDISDGLAGADAVVFAAGAGPGSGPGRKRTVDYGGVVKLVEGSLAKGIRRYVQVSSIGSNHPDNWSEQMRPYYEAKAEGDKVLRESGLDYTIIRPGGLTDDPGTGRVQVGDLEYGQVTRDDVAAVIAECLSAESTIGKEFDLLNGDESIADALRSL
ncbi:MAG TPA: SDR family oxidoreductase [Solirubrobacterales bacterium]|nr:SDR family oxidoreductase [Solirubrobacterales bacterium]